jgi:hypothetical protein
MVDLVVVVAAVVVAMQVEMVLPLNLDNQELEIMEILADVVIVAAAVVLVVPVVVVMVVLVGNGI